MRFCLCWYLKKCYTNASTFFTGVNSNKIAFSQSACNKYTCTAYVFAAPHHRREQNTQTSSILIHHQLFFPRARKFEHPPPSPPPPQQEISLGLLIKHFIVVSTPIMETKKRSSQVVNRHTTSIGGINR